MAGILVIGSINDDDVYRVPHLVASGETLSCDSYTRYPGGKGANQCVALARAGAPVALAGKTGGGVGEGDALAVGLARDAGADVSRVARSDVPTGRAIIQVDDSGANSIILFGGANRAITVGDIDLFLEGWGKGDIALFQNEISCLGEAIARSRALGIRTVLNPSPFDPSLDGMICESVDILVLNEIEGALFAGRAGPLGRDSEEAILEDLARRYPRTDIFLTLGAAGARYAGKDGERLFVPAAPAIPVDTTAAGDCWTGYLLAALYRGTGVRRAMAEAAAAAAVCISRSGAASSIPRRGEVPGLD